MKNKALTLTIVAKMTSNYGEGLGNIGSVQKIYRNGKSYAIRSRESLKNAIMVQSGMYDDLKVDVDSGVTQKSVDENINASNCRALEGGYMNTTGETKIRRSSFYLTDAIAFEPFINEARFHNNLYLAQKSAEQQGINLQKEAKKSGLMPYQYEYDKSMKRYSITFDLDKVGEDLNFDAVADSQEKTERVNCILDAIKDLSLVVRGNMDNAEPLFVVGGIGDKKTHYFENVVSVEEKNLKINDDLLNKLKEGYKAGLLEGNNFDNEEEIEEKIIQYDGLAKLKDAKVVSGEQRINREDLSDEFKNVVSLEATNNTKRNILFSSGVFTIKEGKNIEENDKNSIIVHEEFAKQNNLKLGDEVDLELLDIEKSGKIKSHKFKIIGIFSGKKQETYTGLSSDFSENMVFVDYSTSQEILNNSENNEIANKILMYSGSAESTDLALNKLKELKIDESKYFVEKDSNAFEESLESVSGIKYIIKVMTYSIMLGGMVVLSLILILWLRERIYEIGIFLSIGTSKIQIIMQFIFELIFISIPSIISSLFLGNVLLKVIVDGFINSEDSMISGGSLINNSSFMSNITTLGQSYLILISIIVLSVVFASSLMLIKKPKEILSKIS